MPGKQNLPMKLSPISSICWTSDGYALAMSWGYGGVSVWSVYGSLLLSTVAEDTFVYAADGVVSDSPEVFLGGVQDMFWEKSDYQLYLLPSQTSTLSSKPERRELYVLPFAKSSILKCHSWDNGKNICLIAADRLLYNNGMQNEISPLNMDNIYWETAHVCLLT